MKTKSLERYRGGRMLTSVTWDVQRAAINHRSESGDYWLILLVGDNAYRAARGLEVLLESTDGQAAFEVFELPDPLPDVACIRRRAVRDQQLRGVLVEYTDIDQRDVFVPDRGGVLLLCDRGMDFTVLRQHTAVTYWLRHGELPAVTA